MSGAQADSRELSLPGISDTFGDTTERWRGYPLTNEDAVLHLSTFIQQRSLLVTLLEEMHRLILEPDGKHSSSVREFSANAEGLSAKLQHWLRYLPDELQYRWPMSMGVWELQYLNRKTRQ